MSDQTSQKGSYATLNAFFRNSIRKQN